MASAPAVLGAGLRHRGGRRGARRRVQGVGPLAAHLAHSPGQSCVAASCHAPGHDRSPPRPLPRLRALRLRDQESFRSFKPMSAPIGVFDSGVGGLSVLREIRRELPAEDLLYVADTANAPYGDRDAAFIRERSLAIVARLMEASVKAVVVACNTATGLAVDALRERYALPIVAVEPAVKPAALQTRSGVIGVLATTQTLASERFSRLVATHAAGVTVLTQPSPGLVERVEAGDLSSEQMRTLVARYVGPILARGADS